MSEDREEAEIAAIREDIKRSYGLTPESLVACGDVIAHGMAAHLPAGAPRNAGLAALLFSIWAQMTPQEDQLATDLVLINAKPAEDALSERECERFIALLNALYNGLLHIAKEPTAVINAWFSAHLDVTVDSYGATQAAGYLRQAAKGLPAAQKQRRALKTMDAQATHGAGRA